MKPYRLLAALLPLCLLALPACKKSQASSGLPPARGNGAPALPDFSFLEEDSGEAHAGKNAGLRATGSTYAIDEAQLGPKSSGVLASVLVEEGQRVKKGQLLFTLDAAHAALMVKQAQAALEAAKVGQSRAQLDFDRTQQLFDKGAVAPAMFDQVKLGLEQANVGVTQAEVAVSSAKRALADSAVVSPLTGVVSKRLHNPGETVTMMPPTTVLVVQDLSKIEIRVNLPESALEEVHPGEEMNVQFRALNESIKVPVTRINPSIDARSRTIELVAELGNADGRYKSGMLVECSFEKPASPEANADATGPQPGANGSDGPAASQASTAQAKATKAL